MMGKLNRAAKAATQPVKLQQAALKSSVSDARDGAAHPAADDETVDTLFDGRIKLLQSRGGYRVSLDAVLLAHFVKVAPDASIVDLGAGNGAIQVMLADRYPAARLTGVEIQPAMVARARRNSVLNGLQNRVQVISGDVRAIAELLPNGVSDAVVCNPPYRPTLSGRVSPNPEKRISRHECAGTLEDFLRAGHYLLRQRGRMALIFPAYRSIDLLAAMRAIGIEPKRLRMVHSVARAAAELVLTEGVKGGRSDLVVEAPLCVYDGERRYSAEVATMLAGVSPAV
jgi:tRNA1Val (adenine37-N6)-methyltransferase